MLVKQIEQRTASRVRRMIRMLANRHPILFAFLSLVVVPGLLIGAVFVTTLAVAGPVYLIMGLF